MMLARAAIVIVLLPFAAFRVAAAQEPSLDDILTRAASYVAGFQKQLSGIVAEERYEQNVRSSSSTYFESRRRLRSDLLLVRPIGSDRYVEFRDVFEVDGRTVRDRQDRLTKLFIDPPPGAASQLERVAQESARYNIGNIFRTLNTPVLPMAFLLEQYQPRFEFKLRRGRIGPTLLDMQIGGASTAYRISRDMWTLDYDERARPTLVQSLRGRDMPSRGRFWLDPSTAAVLISELIVDDGDIKATIVVSYQSEPLMGFPVPVEMREVYVAKRDRIEGRATYGRFRKFQVLVDEQIKPVKE